MPPSRTSALKSAASTKRPPCPTPISRQGRIALALLAKKQYRPLPMCLADLPIKDPAWIDITKKLLNDLQASPSENTRLLLSRVLEQRIQSLLPLLIHTTSEKEATTAAKDIAELVPHIDEEERRTLHETLFSNLPSDLNSPLSQNAITQIGIILLASWKTHRNSIARFELLTELRSIAYTEIVFDDFCGPLIDTVDGAATILLACWLSKNAVAGRNLWDVVRCRHRPGDEQIFQEYTLPLIELLVRKGVDLSQEPTSRLWASWVKAYSERRTVRPSPGLTKNRQVLDACTIILIQGVVKHFIDNWE
ncbi:hypothetical protein SISNIDRAFT_464249 [Sistotremastrum niveocremeum HHB9708]|uniref:Uncharacterized protein n=1 Tax=Sistotremastrum niveocremeum HHB9708 TaxID=1314777 RepID=A0A164XHD4_9AGAM|nr:hypothetical protein SISNIDRAFT_464249 [Sistotremastrum niveocremeum HHB9708]